MCLIFLIMVHLHSSKGIPKPTVQENLQAQILTFFRGVELGVSFRAVLRRSRGLWILGFSFNLPFSSVQEPDDVRLLRFRSVLNTQVTQKVLKPFRAVPVMLRKPSMISNFITRYISSGSKTQSSTCETCNLITVLPFILNKVFDLSHVQLPQKV